VPEPKLFGAPASAPVSAGAAPTTAAPSNAGKAPRASSLFDEQRIIESARTAVSRGDSAGALATLDRYQQSYPQGQFVPEALALRIEALSAAGDLTRARSLAAQFQSRYPHHPMLAPVQAAVQGASNVRR
jgi:TolA-binding protein